MNIREKSSQLTGHYKLRKIEKNLNAKNLIEEQKSLSCCRLEELSQVKNQE